MEKMRIMGKNSLKLGDKRMNNDMGLFVKFLAETDKVLIENDRKYNLTKEQKEILKQFIDECYRNFENR